MKKIMVTCPDCRKFVSTGIFTDSLTFWRMPNVISALICPECGTRLNWKAAGAPLEDNETWFEDRKSQPPQFNES